MELLWPELSPRLQQRWQSPNTLSQNGATTARAGLFELAHELATDNAFNLFRIPRLYVETPPVAPLLLPVADERLASLLVYLFGMLLFTKSL
jgi:hypothetical protein